MCAGREHVCMDCAEGTPSFPQQSFAIFGGREVNRTDNIPFPGCTVERRRGLTEPQGLLTPLTRSGAPRMSPASQPLVPSLPPTACGRAQPHAGDRSACGDPAAQSFSPGLRGLAMNQTQG